MKLNGPVKTVPFKYQAESSGMEEEPGENNRPSSSGQTFIITLGCVTPVTSYVERRCGPWAGALDHHTTEVPTIKIV